MENLRVILENGIETEVNGIFYVFNSKYYFIYTTGETEDNEYVRLYVVQVCKEIKNTPNGPIDTGYMIGMEISNPEEWRNVQSSITKIVEDKKNGTKSTEIQYLPINMLVNLKIISKNKFKLMKDIVENNFKVVLPQQENLNNITNTTMSEINIEPKETIVDNSNDQVNLNNIVSEEPKGEVIIDYRARFFEEQEKVQELEEKIKELTEKLENIKSIIE